MIKLLCQLRRRRSRHDDDGSALVIALIVVLAVGIMLAAVIDFAGTGLTSGIQLRDLRNQNYYAEGAVDAAINNIRGSSTAGLPGSTCDYTPDNPSSGVSGASSHTYPVSCVPQTVPGGGGGADQPQYAILTLGPSAPGQRDAHNNPEGLNSDSTGGVALNIDGGVYSHGQIGVNPNSSSMVVDGSVHADGSCVTQAQISTTDSAGPQCNVGASGAGLDPGYKSAVSTSSDLSDLIAGTGNFSGTGSGADPTPICPHSGVVQFSPGYYTELPGTLIKNYSENLSGANQCAGTEQVWWFQPGVYVFAYSGTWTIGNGGGCGTNNPCATQVVGGTPTSTTTSPSGINDWSNGSGQPKDDWNSTPLKAACIPSVDSTTADGVQFNLSGGSKIATLNNGGIELCGPTAHQPSVIAQPAGAANQHIMLYGVSQSIGPQAGTGNFFPATSAPTLGGVWTTNDAVPVPLLDGSRAQTPDNQVARATLIKGQSGTLNYTAFGNIPQGATVQTACLRVYQNLQNGVSSSVKISDTSHSGAGAVTITVPNSSDAACPTPATNPYPGVAPFVDMDISSALTAPAWKDANTTKVLYKADGPSANGVTGTADVDALVLYVTYTMPQVAATTCTPASSCVLWDTTVNLRAFLHGTAYAPTAELDVEVQGDTDTIFDRGVVCETLWVKIVASSTQTTAPFRLPKATPNGRLVLLTARLDGSDARVRACVLFQDYNIPPGGSKTAFPGYAVTVQSWNVFHGAPSGTPTC